MLLTISDCLDRVESLSLSDLYTSASQLPRSGWVRQNIPDPETVSEHQMSAALMVTELFRDKIRRLGVDILTVQDALLIHDLAESDPRVTDRTPHDVYDPESHKKMEERVIREILAYDPRLIELWLNYEYGRTPE
jgi:5'-deoxynucleotidase YfbR-like HD superfamily hydrolase